MRRRRVLGVNYVLGWKVEPSPCGMSCPCNEEPVVEVADDPGWLDADVLFERTQDAQTGYEGR